MTTRLFTVAAAIATVFTPAAGQKARPSTVTCSYNHPNDWVASVQVFPHASTAASWPPPEPLIVAHFLLSDADEYLQTDAANSEGATLGVSVCRGGPEHRNDDYFVCNTVLGTKWSDEALRDFKGGFGVNQGGRLTKLAQELETSCRASVAQMQNTPQNKRPTLVRRLVHRLLGQRPTGTG